MKRLAAILSALLLAACAGMNTVTSEVASFGDWPAGRATGTYVFERLPSQQARAAEHEKLEAAVRPALAAAGFKSAAPGTAADHIVQLGARLSRSDPSPWDDPLWWRGCIDLRRCGPWLGPRWAGPWASPLWRAEPPRYEREVALLVRDGASGKPLFETRARSEGGTVGSAALWQAMFSAAMKDFPSTTPQGKTVVVPLVATD